MVNSSKMRIKSSEGSFFLNRGNGFGVTPDIRSQMKLWFFYVCDIVVFFVFLGFTILLGNLFPAGQGVQLIVFYIINIIFGLWLIIQPLGNPGKRNYEILVHDMLPQQRIFRSYDMQEFYYSKYIVPDKINRNN